MCKSPFITSSFDIYMHTDHLIIFISVRQQYMVAKYICTLTGVGRGGGTSVNNSLKIIRKYVKKII